MKTKQEIKEDLWSDAELESDGWQSRMEYNEFMLTLDKYEKALKNMESSSRIIDRRELLEAFKKYSNEADNVLHIGDDDIEKFLASNSL